MRARWVIVGLIAVLLSCTSERPAPSETPAAPFVAQDQMYFSNGEAEPAARPFAEVAVTTAKLPVITRPDATKMIIRTATALIEVDSLESAVAQVKQLAARVGGYVANSGMELGGSRRRQAVIQVKIPADRFEEAVSGLKPIGKLESDNVNAQDVGEEYVDVIARIDNARRLERRLIDLLATRTGKLKDVLDVEQELARVREEIERYQGRVRYLEAHTAVSTLTVTLHEPVPVVGEAGESIMGDAFRGAWRNFVVLVAGFVQSLGILIPLGALAFVVWVVVKRSRRVAPQSTT
ncbi:MAG TPA: DUF4349 domain-containing protein [Gemmatimonadales bacterium]|nr:DUF4349 domain-containing protein [Gemmatimonadales bacterium]